MIATLGRTDVITIRNDMKKIMLLITVIAGVTAPAYSIKDDQEKLDDIEINLFFDAYNEEAQKNHTKIHLYADKMYRNKRFQELTSRANKAFRQISRIQAHGAEKAVKKNNIQFYRDAIAAAPRDTVLREMDV